MPESPTHFYRAFVRYGLRAVQYKTPHRYIYMNIIRRKFETTTQVAPETIQNTLQFVKNAAAYNCMEAKIIFNMIHVEYGRQEVKADIVRAYGKQGSEKQKSAGHRTKGAIEQYDFVYGGFDDVVKSLNKTMNLCL